MDRDPALPFPLNGVRYSWEEPHPYIPKASEDYGTLCEVCGVQPRDGHPYPPPHAFLPYGEHGWRKCVHCGECRVNMQHPTERSIRCGALAEVGSLPNGYIPADAFPVACVYDLERYPDHPRCQASIGVYGADGRLIDSNYISWRRQP